MLSQRIQIGEFLIRESFPGGYPESFRALWSLAALAPCGALHVGRVKYSGLAATGAEKKEGAIGSGASKIDRYAASRPTLRFILLLRKPTILLDSRFFGWVYFCLLFFIRVVLF